jgi:hypothetical protein
VNVCIIKYLCIEHLALYTYFNRVIGSRVPISSLRLNQKKKLKQDWGFHLSIKKKKTPHWTASRPHCPGTRILPSLPSPLPFPDSCVSKSDTNQRRAAPREHVGRRCGRRDPRALLPRAPAPAWPPLAADREAQAGACRSRSGGRRGRDRPPPPWRAPCRRSSCWTLRAASSSGATIVVMSPRFRPSASSPSSSTRR